MDKKNLLQKLSDIIGVNFSTEERAILADVSPVAPAATPATPATPPATTGDAKEFKTVDGVSVFITGVDTDGKIDPVNSSVYTDATMTTPATDGEYKLDNGMTITVLSGKVAEVSNADEEAQDKAMGEEMKKMVSQMSVQSAKIEALEKLITKSNEATLLLTKTVTKILDTPVNFQMNIETPKAKKTYDELSPLQKIQFNRGEITL